MSITERFISTAGAGAHDGTSEANSWTWAEMLAAVNALGAGGAAGLRGNVKADGTYSRTTATDTFTVGGTATSPFILRAYLSTPGDYYLGRTNGHCCGGNLITTNFAPLTYTTGRLTLTTWTVLEGFSYSTQINGGALVGGADGAIRACVVNNTGTGASVSGLTPGGRGLTLDCDLSTTASTGTGAAVTATNASTRTIGCRIKNAAGGGPGVNLASTGVFLGNCVYGGAGVGVAMNNTGGSPVIAYNTITANSGDGIDIITGTTGLQALFGNLITDNGGYGIDGVSAANAIVAAYNRLRDNTGGPTNLATDWLAATIWGHVTTDTGGPETDYQNAGGNDYRLTNGSPAQNMFYGSAAGAWQFNRGLLVPQGFISL